MSKNKYFIADYARLTAGNVQVRHVDKTMRPGPLVPVHPQKAPTHFPIPKSLITYDFMFATDHSPDVTLELLGGEGVVIDSHTGHQEQWLRKWMLDIQERAASIADDKRQIKKWRQSLQAQGKRYGK